SPSTWPPTASDLTAPAGDHDVDRAADEEDEHPSQKPRTRPELSAASFTDVVTLTPREDEPDEQRPGQGGRRPLPSPASDAVATPIHRRQRSRPTRTSATSDSPTPEPAAQGWSGSSAIGPTPVNDEATSDATFGAAHRLASTSTSVDV